MHVVPYKNLKNPLKSMIAFKAINRNKPLTVILNLFQDLLTVMKQVLREILKQVQDDGDAVETRNLNLEL